MKKFADFRAEILPMLDAQLGLVMQASPARGSALHEMIHFHHQTGGKRLRAMAVLWIAHGIRCQAGKIEKNWFQDILPFALAVELIHNATLIHDDLQDGDEVRRGQPTLWKKYSPAQAINCGDLLFFEALRLLTGSAYENSLKLALVDLLQEKTIRVIQGQGEELILKERLQASLCAPSFAEYEKMVQGKTAALFLLPILGAAKIVGAPAALIGEIEAGAKILGQAFQINDDYIDLWGKKGRAARGSDIAEGKFSYPVLRGLEAIAASDAAEAKKMISILAAPRNSTSAEDIEWCIGRLEREGIRKRCEEEVARLKLELEKLPLVDFLLLPLFEAAITGA